ncbi:Cyclin-Dependent Kinase 4 Inhibitor B [Manis pentadactyla]|nr:Cyclin-Dependent Kinase 4 Inhibitor B [Manis pentadactyla]
MEGEGQGSEMEGQPAWTRIPRDKSVQKGSQDPQGGGQVRHLCRWDPTSCHHAQSRSAAFTDLCIQLCSPVVILDLTEQQ